MTDLIPVNIVIADRTYRLKIEAKDEEMVRKTANLINEKVTEFRTQFAGKDTQDYVSMVLLWFATDQTHSGLDMVKWEEASEKLSSLEKLLDKALG
ncbi:cell division protein ZapA [Sediminibacterium soli]|uniref:cell division protein ZapA n=1 Tax=Sediminibacterium soli TaxID=2698829 RepID=UPI00137A8862|nr:cell division protein ZapA [Sediminibacterium soli]NCI45464.1 cell division protein ZapA [Sediminibacterium soli]